MATDREVIERLAGGDFIAAIDLGGYDGYEYSLRSKETSVDESQLRRLIDHGWLYSTNTSYRLTDEGKKAYMRSMDELGDGTLVPPMRFKEQS